MPRKLPLHVVRQKTRHKKFVFYYREGKGKRIRLPDPSTDEFKPAYEACLRGQPIAAKAAESTGSIAWLLARYMESAEWAAMGKGTLRQRSNIFHHLKTKYGSHPFSRITKKAIENGMEDRRRTPAQANNYLKAMVGLCKWAVRNNHMQANPTEGVERIKVKSSGFPAWDMSDVRAYCAKWEIGTTQRLAIEIAMHTGLRRGDLVRVGPQHMRGNVLSIQTSKTGAHVTVELPQRVIDIIAATDIGPLNFLVTSFGKPFSDAGFGNWFGEAARDAGVRKNTHGLRKLAATTAANGGATAHELMSQFGWTNSKQAEVYTRGADRARLGLKASRIISSQFENELIPHPAKHEGKNEKMKTESKAEK